MHNFLQQKTPEQVLFVHSLKIPLCPKVLFSMQREAPRSDLAELYE
jgi:hypothetical protein